MKKLLIPVITSLLCMALLAACNNNPQQSKTEGAQQNTPPVGKNDTAAWPKPPANPNIKDGLNETHYDNGVIKTKGYYRDGRRIGEWQSFYPSGKLWSDEFFTDGLADGKVDVYYENGQKMYEGVNEKGKPVGIWHYWNQKGELIRSADYSKKPANSAL